MTVFERAFPLTLNPLTTIIFSVSVDEDATKRKKLLDDGLRQTHFSLLILAESMARSVFTI